MEEKKQAENQNLKVSECLRQMGECFQGGKTPEDNINRLVCICGEFLGAACALYNRLEGGKLYSAGLWHAPADYKPLDNPEGHICYDVIRRPENTPLIIRDLQNSHYARTDPNVSRYKLETYVGVLVRFNDVHIGALCAVFQKDFSPTAEEIGFMQVLASAIGIEEDRRKTQLELEASNKRYKLICDTVTDYIFTVHIKDGKPTKVVHGPACVHVTGYTAEEFASDPDLWIKIVSAEDRARVAAHTGLILAGEKVAPIEHGITRKGGIVRWIKNTVVSHFDENGKLASYDDLVQDITEQKLAEIELNRQKEDLEVIFDSAPMMIFYKDRNNKMIRVNQAFCEVMGAPKEEVEGKSCFDLWPGEAEHYWQDDKEVMDSGIPKIGIIESLLTKKYGERWVLTDKVPYRNEKGEIIGIIGLTVDITDRKEAAEALRASEEEYRTLVYNVNIGVYRTTPDNEGRFLRANPAMAKMFGYDSEEELIKHRVAELYHDPRRRLKLLEKMKEDGFVKNEEMLFKKKDGTPVWVAVTARMNLDEGGRPLWLDGVIEDITERKRAEEKLESLNKELLKTNKRLKQLVLRDPQTGLFNHRYVEEAIEAEFYRAKRYAHPLSVMMVDVDYFKSINDVYGHHFGDMVLKQLAGQIKKMVRQYDVVIRFGGEEFMIISPAIDRAQAMVLARRLLDAINLYNFGDRKQTVKLKLSIAVTSYPEDKIFRGMELIALADQILDKVKDFGGNNVYSSSAISRKTAPIQVKSRLNGDIKFLRDKIDRLNRKTNQSLVEAVFAFAKTIELKDQSTGEHVEKTVHYATEIARAMNLSDEEIERIKQAAILHDLGKIGISESILSKKGKLTRDEFEDIKRHPQIGVDIIRPIKFLHSVIPLILHHHERWDGKGYPAGLKGEEIPIGSRIVALADVYEALTSNRPYRKAYSEKEAINLIKKGSGTQFDPRVVTKFLQLAHKKK